MRSKRSVRLEAKWREIVSGHPCSGQTVQAYCKARQVIEASFFFWRHELERRAHLLAVRPHLIPIRILPYSPPTPVCHGPRTGRSTIWISCWLGSHPSGILRTGE